MKYSRRQQKLLDHARILRESGSSNGIEIAILIEEEVEKRVKLECDLKKLVKKINRMTDSGSDYDLPYVKREMNKR